MKTSLFTVLLFGVFIIIITTIFLLSFELIFRLGQKLMEKSNALEDEIIQRQEAQNQAETSLKERELLLQEIHHRVKNNLQIISSLLRLQSHHLGDPKIEAILNDSRSRIGAMSLIHKTLYKPTNLASVSFHDYINELALQLFDFYAVDPNRITLATDLESISLNIETATPCGLIINELVTNALKYAFPENRKGLISVVLKRNDQGSGYLLRISDNGVGLPAGLDIRHIESLGLSLAVNLAEKQLQGQVDISRNQGTTFDITFQEIGYPQRL
ncbi:MAG: sensor histidine kinase [Proteobacteria bacterium]|nr:sensor histidine kinase [Pseudomonadota bacterium]MBU1686894.1 sensor histidine kinase [Pseudomonadota bacterium]